MNMSAERATSENFDLTDVIRRIHRMERMDGRPHEGDLLALESKGVVMPTYTMENPAEFTIVELDLQNQ